MELMEEVPLIRESELVRLVCGSVYKYWPFKSFEVAVIEYGTLSIVALPVYAAALHFAAFSASDLVICLL